MRMLIWALVLVAALWSGWWMLAGWMLERGIAGWQENRRAAGWQADVEVGATAGFPMRLTQELRGIAVADRAAGVALRADAVDLSAPTYWPGDLDLRLPETPMQLTRGARQMEVTVQDGLVALRLHPGAALELERVTALTGPLRLAEVEGNLFQVNGLRAELVQGALPARYDGTLQINGLTPGGNLRAALGLPLDWPLAFDAFDADLALTFDRPLDRRSRDQTPPELRGLEMSSVDLRWGALGLKAEGTVTFDAAGVPEGAVNLAFEGWRDALIFAERAGVMPARTRPQAEFMLNMLANRGADPEVLELTLEMRGGSMTLEGFPLGPAPRLQLR